MFLGNISNYQTTLRHIVEDRILHSHQCENLIYQIFVINFQVFSVIDILEFQRKLLLTCLQEGNK
jgi:hypothetical protein